MYCLPYVHKIISWHKKTWISEQGKQTFSPIFWHLTMILCDFTGNLVFVHLILFFSSLATLSLRIGCSGDSNVGTYQLNTFVLKKWSVTHHLPSIVTDRQVDNFDSLFPGDACALFFNRRSPSRITAWECKLKSKNEKRGRKDESE